MQISEAMMNALQRTNFLLEELHRKLEFQELVLSTQLVVKEELMEEELVEEGQRKRRNLM